MGTIEGGTVPGTSMDNNSVMQHGMPAQIMENNILFDEHVISTRKVRGRKGSKSSKQDKRYFKSSRKNSRIEDPNFVYNTVG